MCYYWAKCLNLLASLGGGGHRVLFFLVYNLNPPPLLLYLQTLKHQLVDTVYFPELSETFYL